MEFARSTSVLLGFFVITGCTRDRVDVGAERAALLELDRQWAQAAAQGQDIDSILSFWADDAVVIPPGQAPVVGKAALRGMVTSTTQIPGFSITWQSDSVHVSPDGQMAYMFSKNQVTLPDAQGKPVVSRGRAVTVWRKGSDGKWKCVVDIWNDEPPAKTAA